MLLALDPAVAAVEAVLRKAEGPLHALGRYYPNPDDADRARRVAAGQLVRVVDRARGDLIRPPHIDAEQLDLLPSETLRA